MRDSAVRRVFKQRCQLASMGAIFLKCGFTKNKVATRILVKPFGYETKFYTNWPQSGFKNDEKLWILWNYSHFPFFPYLLFQFMELSIKDQLICANAEPEPVFWGKGALADPKKTGSSSNNRYFSSFFVDFCLLFKIYS